MKYSYDRALIVGVGDGLSASLARLFKAEGMAVALAARTDAKMAALAEEIGAVTATGDASKPGDVARIFETAEAGLGGAPDVVVYNPSARVRGPLVELDRARVADALMVSAYGAFLVAQRAVPSMLEARKGAVLLTGASAGVKGFPQSAPFAMGKFALRGLAESMARELHPKGIHIGHVVIDGAIRNPGRSEPADKPDSMLDPDAIAETYLSLLKQDRSAWTHEVAVRPFVESF